MTEQALVGSETAGGGSGRRDRAVDRSLGSARSRAERRVQCFIDAGLALVTERGSTDFTVQGLVHRSEQSLRSFYQYFDGKHELLLALFEESVLRTAEDIRGAVEVESEPLARLRAFVTSLFAACRPGSDEIPRPMAKFGLEVFTSHPAQAAAAQAPLFELLVSLVEDAIDEGALRPANPRRLAALLLQTVEFAAPCTRGSPVTSAEVWQFCLEGVRT